jgi:acyl transferase domain-containing protein
LRVVRSRRDQVEQRSGCPVGARWEMDPPVAGRTLGGVQDTDIANSIAAGRPTRAEPRPASAAGVHELLLLDAETVPELRGRVAGLTDQVAGPALGDLAATLQRGLADRPVRAGVVAASADQARERLTRLAARLRGDDASTLDVANGVFAGRAGGKPAIGYLFPGQGAGVGTGESESALTRRFETVRDLYRTVTVPAAEYPAWISAAQQRIVASSVAGLRVLSMLGIQARAAAGHSLGELTALHWAGAMSEAELLALVGAHGQIMADTCDGSGAMGRIAAHPDQVEPLLRGEPVVIAGYNSPVQTVVAGPAQAVARVRQAAVAAGLQADGLPVGDALHSPAMAPAADKLRAHLAGMRFGPLERSVVSTVTGDVLPPGTDLHDLLVRQVCEPVRFSQVVGRMADQVSLLVEVGPDQTLSYLAPDICPNVCFVPLATDGASLSGVLCAAAAAYVLGAPVRHDRLVAGPPAHGKGT